VNQAFVELDKCEQAGIGWDGMAWYGMVWVAGQGGVADVAGSIHINSIVLFPFLIFSFSHFRLLSYHICIFYICTFSKVQRTRIVCIASA
jgi:hypothetical protein